MHTQDMSSPAQAHLEAATSDGTDQRLAIAATAGTSNGETAYSCAEAALRLLGFEPIDMSEGPTSAALLKRIRRQLPAAIAHEQHEPAPADDILRSFAKRVQPSATCRLHDLPVAQSANLPPFYNLEQGYATEVAGGPAIIYSSGSGRRVAVFLNGRYTAGVVAASPAVTALAGRTVLLTLDMNGSASSVPRTDIARVTHALVGSSAAAFEVLEDGNVNDLFGSRRVLVFLARPVATRTAPSPAAVGRPPEPLV